MCVSMLNSYKLFTNINYFKIFFQYTWQGKEIFSRLKRHYGSYKICYILIWNSDRERGSIYIDRYAYV